MKIHIENFEAITFDFDGTLANTYSTHEKARMEAFEAHGYGYIPAEAHRLGHTYGSSAPTIIAGGLKAAGENDPGVDHNTDPTVGSIVELKTAKYHEAVQHGLDAQPGAVEFVRKLAGRFSGRL